MPHGPRRCRRYRRAAERTGGRIERNPGSAHQRQRQTGDLRRSRLRRRRRPGLLRHVIDDAFRRSASLADRVLKGASPAETPFEQPTRVAFVVNLKTAKALRLTIPQSVLLRADELIQ
ncbi:MAG TPA: ABC transporter substrate binding protein [Caldimonas sp.]